MEKIAVISGGFDPLHSGHIRYMKEAARLGRLIVGLNSDEWLARKKGRPFLRFKDRYDIISNLRMVDLAIDFNDLDDTANSLIEMVLRYETEAILIFCNGGDRGATNTPEYTRWHDHPRVEFAFGIGGDDKQNSSSKILEEWVDFKHIEEIGMHR